MTLAKCCKKILLRMGVKPGLTTKEEHRLSVFENRLLRRLFQIKKDVRGVCSLRGGDEECVQNFGWKS
jgi:hypothetical protein